MTPENQVTIRETTVQDIRDLVADLRVDDLREIEKWGVSPFKGIWRAYRNSLWSRSLFMGDKIMAIGGLNGGLLGFVGNPWLFTSNVVDEYPLVFATIYRRETKEMLKSYRVLETFCDMAYDKSLKMMRIIGFRECEFVPTPKGLLVRLEMEAV